METRDCIHIRGLRVFAYHGVFDFEKRQGQTFIVNARLYTDLSKAGKSDRLEDSTHYGEVCQRIKESLTKQSYDLLERAAQKTVEDIFFSFPLIDEIVFELQKPEAPVDMEFDTLSIEIKRGWEKVFIAFGSNLGDRQKHIDTAVEKIRNNPYFRRIRVSEYAVTAPYGGVKQEEFLNGVLEAETIFNPGQLLGYLHTLEAQAKRERLIRWGPRTLDLDILFFGQRIIDDEELTIPHKDMENRDFVLLPLMQLAPWFRHPITKKTVEEMAGEVKQSYVKERQAKKEE